MQDRYLLGMVDHVVPNRGWYPSNERQSQISYIFPLQWREGSQYLSGTMIWVSSFFGFLRLNNYLGLANIVSLII